jgi:MFS family permease
VNAAQPGILRKILPAAGQDSASAHGGGGMQDAGNASGSIVLWAEITVILLSPIWGALADRMGGRFVNVSGFIFAAAGLAIIPSCGSIEALTAARCLFSVGGAALGSTLSSILAHTVLQADKGKGAALAGTAASFGAIFAALCLLRIPAIAEQMAAAGAPGGIGVPGASYVHCAYYTAACFAMFGAAVGAWHLYDKKVEGAAQAAPAECDGQGMQKKQREAGLVLRLSEVSNVSLSRARECLAILRADVGMCLALAAALQARGDASTVTVFLALWVNEYSKDVNGVSGAQAARAAGAATGLVYTLSLLSGPPWGIVVDRLGDARSHPSITKQRKSLPSLNGLSHILGLTILGQVGD